MTRAQLRALVTELQRRYPDLEVELAPHLTTQDGFPGPRYRIDVGTRVSIPLYVNSRGRLRADMIPHLLVEEIDAFREAVAVPALERARRERFYRRANHYSASALFEHPMGPWQPVDTRRDPSWNPMACARADAAGTGCLATFVFPQTGAPTSTAEPARLAKPVVPEAMSLWEKLGSED